jgi:predicted O-methyltransferase YrrM
MAYTTDWFDQNIRHLSRILDGLRGKENLKFLEIGSYEGRSTVWFLENILTHETSKITCIDLFTGEVEDNDFSKFEGLNSNYYQDFLENIEQHKEKVSIMRGYSYKELRKINEYETFDFIYIDGAHTSFELICDAVLSEPLLKVGGIIVFDDYLWRNQNDPEDSNYPKLAIDCFMSLFNQQYTIILDSWQIALQKNKNLHIYN